MPEFRSIEIDFDVHKRIELARESFSETPNAVLRRLLGLDAPAASRQRVNAIKGVRAWSGKGVVLPHGTHVRMEYNGRTHEGEILDGAWLVEGERYTSPSAAAGGVARTRDGKRTNLDGWIYWSVLPPGRDGWVKLAHLREAKPSEDSAGIKVGEERREMRRSFHSGTELPPESEVMIALESYLAKVKRPVTPSEAYRALADHFHLTAEQRSRLMDNGKDCHWENRVRFARRKLVDAGVMAREPRGLWMPSS